LERSDDRRDSFAKIPQHIVYYEPTRPDNLTSWKNQTEFAFVISPHGNGLDCHRTWEALVLGCIPIVKASSIDCVYENLPVLIVRDWSDITADLLTSTIDSFSNRSFEMEKLTLHYWVELMHSVNY
jgi:hypothetical protein